MSNASNRPASEDHNNNNNGDDAEDAGAAAAAAAGPSADAKEGEEERVIPLEIDDHFRLFGKHPWEVEYGEKCPECQSRIDEYGLCSCGSNGG